MFSTKDCQEQVAFFVNFYLTLENNMYIIMSATENRSSEDIKKEEIFLNVAGPNDWKPRAERGESHMKRSNVK